MGYMGKSLVKNSKQKQKLWIEKFNPRTSREILYWWFCVVGAQVIWHGSEHTFIQFLFSGGGGAVSFLVVGGFMCYLGFLALFIRPKNKEHERDLASMMFLTLLILNMLLSAGLFLQALLQVDILSTAFAIYFALEAYGFYKALDLVEIISFAHTRLEGSEIILLPLAAVALTVALAPLPTSPVVQTSILLSVGTLFLQRGQVFKKIEIIPSKKKGPKT